MGEWFMLESKRTLGEAAQEADGAEGDEKSGDAALVFKQADSDRDFAEIFRLNYASFVEEVPQHPANPHRVLVDRFHEENTYFICLRDTELAGMVCVRDHRPFSLDEKLGNLEQYLPQAKGAALCEVRLLAVRPDMRRTRVLQGLLSMVALHCQQAGHDYVVISGRVSQEALYRHIGFIPFGPVVGDDAAPYQPMYRPVGNVGAEFAGLFHNSLPSPAEEPVILTPGPVKIPKPVSVAFQHPPVSHRSGEFAALMLRVKDRLLELTGAEHVAVMAGSGTLANDMVAAQLFRLSSRGLIVSAGEFGSRLFDHANRFGLSYKALEQHWGEPLDYDRIEAEAAVHTGGWLWAVHCETSTGALADLARLKTICREYGLRLALDCVSSLGATTVDLRGVWLASTASGKGLAAYPGLAIVFSSQQPRVDLTLPRYLDLGLHMAAANKGSVPFTLSSNLLCALEAGLERQTGELLTRIEDDGRWLRVQLRALGLHLVSSESESMGAVTTIALQDDLTDASELGISLASRGYFTSYASSYLRDNNWLQICLMGEVNREELERLIPVLASSLPFRAQVSVPQAPI